MSSGARPPLLMLGAPPRGGNHLLRGLLDSHPQLLIPPDEDYFVRQLSRHPLQRWRGALTPKVWAPAFYRQLQKNGHLERINANSATEVSGTANALDLAAYYDYICRHHRCGDMDALVINHVEGMARALGYTSDDKRLRVFFCALQPGNQDLTRVSSLLARSYDVRGIFLLRDPRAHLHSKIVRNPQLNVHRFCQRQNDYVREIECFNARAAPALCVRFEDLVTDTETRMREVCEFAGIEFSPTVLEYTQGGIASVGNSSFTVSSGIDQRVVSRYQGALPAATSAYLERHCVPELFWHAPSGG